MSAEEKPFEPDTTLAAIDAVMRTLIGEGLQRAHENNAAATPPEHMDVPAIKEAVGEQLDRYHQMLRDSLAPGADTDEMGPFSHSSIARTALLTVLIHRAGASGDTEQVDEYMTTLELLTAAGMESIYTTKLQIRAMRYGSLRAHAGLHRTLAQDQEARQARGNVGATDVPLEAARFTYLAETITEMVAAELPAEQLIDTYATDPIDRLSHYLHYLRLHRDKKPPQERINELEEVIAQTYLLLPNATAYAVYSPELITSVRDERKRRAMYERFLSAQKAEMANGAKGVPKQNYAALLDALVTVPPSAISPQNRPYLYRLGRRALESFKPKELEPWIIDATVAMGATPQQVVSMTNQIADVDKRRLGDEQPKLTRVMDDIFGKHARRFAECGDFEGAQVFIKAMTSAYKASETIADCMKHAQTAGQRSLLQGDELQQLIHPELDINWRVAEAMSLRDDDKLEAAIRDLVAYATEAYSNPSDSVVSDDHLKEYRDVGLLEDAFARMNPDRALALARELKAQVVPDPSQARGKSFRPMVISRHLSEILINLGAPEEVRQKYAAAMHAGVNTTFGMVECVQLAGSFFRRPKDK